MRIYMHLALAYLKKHKTRTFSMILGVSLAIMLILGVNVISESQNKKQLDVTYEMYGWYDGILSNLTKDKSDKMKKDKDIKEVVGVASFGEGISDDGTSISLSSSDEKYINMNGYEIRNGRLPSKDGEIVLEDNVLKEMELDESLNQTIRFKVKKEYKDEFGKNQIFMETNTFKLVGIITRPDEYYYDWTKLKGFTFYKEGETKILPKDLITYENIVKLGSRANVSRKLNNIITRYDIDYNDLTENEILVMALSEYRSSKNNQSEKDTKRLIITTAIILIYNMFNMSLIDMIKQIGLLRAVGVTKKKVRLIICIQSVIVLIVGTLIGIAFGVLFAYFGMTIFSNNILNVKINISSKDIIISMKNIINAIKISSITVIISSLIPIWISGKISPIEALRKIDNTNINNKKGFHHNLIKKVFGLTGEMAYRNISRNKLRAIVSILAISMGGILFIDNMSVWNNTEFNDESPKYREMGEGSIKLYTDVNTDINFRGYTVDDVDKIYKIDGVKNIKTKSNIVGFLKSESEYLETNMLISGYDDRAFKKLKKYTENGTVPEKNKEQLPRVIVSNYHNSSSGGGYEEVRKGLKIGDILTIKVPIVEDNNISYEDRKVKVGSLLEKRWIIEGDSTFGSVFEIIVPEDDLLKMTNKKIYNELFIETENGKDEKVDNEVKELFKNKPFVKIKSISDEKKLDLEHLRQIKKGNLIIVSLILFIAAVNMFGTIRTSLLIRINEFSILKSIGMTNKQVKNMIVKETIIYGILSSLIAGIIGTYKYFRFISNYNNLYKKDFNINSALKFNIPILQIIQFTISTMVICIIVAYISRRKIDKLNIVDGLKNID